MPTGYTAIIQDGGTFEQFVWACARQFGALIMMRDEPSNAKVPEKFEPSDFYEKELEQAKARLLKLTSMSQDELREEYGNHLKKLDAAKIERRERDASTKARYEAALEKARAWVPPTPDHKGLKDFMISQIQESIDFDIIGPGYDPKYLTFGEWKAEEKERALRNIERYSTEHVKELERTKGRNAWVDALRKSVPQP
jgi:hypothetical protein